MDQMELRDRIGQALKQAMRDKDQGRLATLRLINAAIKDQEIAARGGDEPAALGDTEIRAILARMVKQRHESVRAYEEGGRVDLAERERAEMSVIEEFLPRQLDGDEIDAAIDRAIADVGAATIRDMGKIMGKLKERHAGQMDFGAVGAQVKARLG
jgi:hypothetical protein